jgi:uncharacterized tellurite resistance protein B-like protein
MEQNINDDTTGLSSKMALCLAAISLVGIDGEFKEEELNKLRTFVRNDEMAFLKAYEFYSSRSLDTCIQVVGKKLTDEQKMATYSILHNLAHADSAVAESEKELLQKYAQNFKLTEKTISNILKNPFTGDEINLF